MNLILIMNDCLDQITYRRIRDCAINGLSRMRPISGASYYPAFFAGPQVCRHKYKVKKPRQFFPSLLRPKKCYQTVALEQAPQGDQTPFDHGRFDGI
jgi:hypothetical protein